MGATIPFIPKTETVEANILRRTGDLLRQCREINGISLEDACRLVNVSPQKLWLWEIGRKSPRAKTFHHLIFQYGVEAMRDARTLFFQLQIERYHRLLRVKIVERKVPAVIYRLENAA